MDSEAASLLLAPNGSTVTAIRSTADKKPVLEIHFRFNIENITSVDTVEQTFKARVFMEGVVPGGSRISWLTLEMLEKRYFGGMTYLNFQDEQTIYSSVSEVDGDYIMRWRIFATFEESMELQKFPFDYQDLHMEFSVSNSNEGSFPVRCVPLRDKSRIMETRSALNTWRLMPGINMQVQMTDPKMSGRGSTYPRLTVSIGLHRYSSYYIWNVAVPMCAFVFMAFMCEFVPPSDAADRLGLSLTLVLTAAAYKFVVARMLPAIAYKTFLDEYVEICALFLFLLTIENGVMSSPELQPWDTFVIRCMQVLFLLVNLNYGVRACWLTQVRRAAESGRGLQSMEDLELAV